MMMTQRRANLRGGALTSQGGLVTCEPRVIASSSTDFRRRCFSFRLACVVLLGGSSVGAEPVASAPVAGWELLAGYLFGDAHGVFAARADAGDRRDRLGLAASLINHPPVTAGKVSRAEGILRDLLADGADDEPARYARYLLARIAHLHQAGGVARAEAGYREVIAADAGHPLAQVAAGKLALLLLYERTDLPVPDRLTAAAALAPVAGAGALPEAACAYYRALAGAALFYDVLDERVYDWLKKAEEVGTIDVLAASSLRIQLAEVAQALGRRDEALGHYRNFLASVLPTDNRYLTARERMEALEAAR